MESNALVGSHNGSAGWQYNSWDIDLAAWGWAADQTQGAATFQVRDTYRDGYYNQNDFYTMLAAPENRPYLELEYSGGNPGDPQAPEPGSFALLGGGLAAAAAIRVFRVRGANGGTRG
jgi:PEP-CTERM motif.